MIGYTIRHRVRFVQYTLLGVLAFSFDLFLLFLFNTYLAIPYYVAVPVAFLIATTAHYALLRVYVFHDTTRPTTTGYAYFLTIMCSNAIAITLLVSGLVEVLDAELYVARTGVGALFGVLSFFLNSRYNFRIL